MELIQGYIETDAGVIPADWKAVSLGQIGESLIGLTYKPTDVRSDGVLVLRSSNVSDGFLRFDDNVFVEKDIPEKLMVRPGDILICVRNGSRNLIGKCAQIDERARGMTFGAFMTVFRSPLHDFVYQHLQSGLIRRQINEHLGATINQITNKSLNSFKIPLPPTAAEQEVIAGALSDVDSFIKSLERLIAKKRDVKQAAMQLLLTGRRRLPGFSAKWKVRRLGDVAEIDPENLGCDTSPAYSFNYISLEDVDLGSLSGYSEQVFRTAPSRARRRLRQADILLATVRPNLRSHLLFTSSAANWICSTGFSVIRCRPQDAVPGYIFSHLFGDKVMSQIDSLLTGSNYPAINADDVKSLEVPMPSVPEQVAISDVISDMGAEIATLELRRDKTFMLKQGMMQELLTGKTRLK